MEGMEDCGRGRGSVVSRERGRSQGMREVRKENEGKQNKKGSKNVLIQWT